jgi:polysaccharide export outer membrane protein
MRASISWWRSSACRSASRIGRSARIIAALLLVAACAAPPPSRVAAPETEYRLGPGDRVHVDVFGEPDMSGDYDVDSVGMLPLKLIGRIEARGQTGHDLDLVIERRLADGYLQNPHVSVSVIAYRPFYVLGEVQKPGPYPYVVGMTVAHAVAIAGGYTYRASKSSITVQHFDDPGAQQDPVDEASPVLPGDLVRISERMF